MKISRFIISLGYITTVGFSILIFLTSFCSLLALVSESGFLNALADYVIWTEIQLPLLLWIMLKAFGEAIGLLDFDRASFINFDQVLTQKCITFFDSPINCIVLILISLIFFKIANDIVAINKSTE